MSFNQDLNAIFDRIVNGEEVERDMQTLPQLLRGHEDRNSILNAKNIKQNLRILSILNILGFNIKQKLTRDGKLQ
jgi:hypothetical protein